LNIVDRKKRLTSPAPSKEYENTFVDIFKSLNRERMPFALIKARASRVFRINVLRQLPFFGKLFIHRKTRVE